MYQVEMFQILLAFNFGYALVGCNFFLNFCLLLFVNFLLSFIFLFALFYLYVCMYFLLYIYGNTFVAVAVAIAVASVVYCRQRLSAVPTVSKY